MIKTNITIKDNIAILDFELPIYLFNYPDDMAFNEIVKREGIKQIIRVFRFDKKKIRNFIRERYKGRPSYWYSEFDEVYNEMLKERDDQNEAISEIKELSGVITPEDIVNLELPDAIKEGFADKLVVISGRAPIWLYCVIAFVYRQCKGVAVYDTRVNGAEIIQTNSKDYKFGQIVGIY